MREGVRNRRVQHLPWSLAYEVLVISPPHWTYKHPAEKKFRITVQLQLRYGHIHRQCIHWIKICNQNSWIIHGYSCTTCSKIRAEKASTQGVFLVSDIVILVYRFLWKKMLVAADLKSNANSKSLHFLLSEFILSSAAWASPPRARGSPRPTWRAQRTSPCKPPCAAGRRTVKNNNA